MLIQEAPEVVCKGTQHNFQQVFLNMISEGDAYIGRYTDLGKVLEAIQNIDQEIKTIYTDMMAFFVGTDHSHLVAFYRGCHQYVINLDMFNTHIIMELLK